MNDEQNSLRNPEPECAVCFAKKSEVKVLAKVHSLYMCDVCCKNIKIAMKIDPTSPPEAA